MPKSRRRKNITGECALTNFIFSRVIEALNNKVLIIYKVKRLVLENDKRGPLYGCIVPLDGYKLYEMYVSGQKSLMIDRDEMAKTILHEALHIVFESCSEKIIWRLERLVWDELCKEQRELLKSYIPRCFSKQKPD